MIDYDKITEYMTTMGLNVNGGFQLSAFAINEMLGNHYSISEKDLHDGVEWLKAKMKKEVEENPYWTTEHGLSWGTMWMKTKPMCILLITIF